MPVAAAPVYVVINTMLLAMEAAQPRLIEKLHDRSVALTVSKLAGNTVGT